MSQDKVAIKKVVTSKSDTLSVKKAAKPLPKKKEPAKKSVSTKPSALKNATDVKGDTAKIPAKKSAPPKKSGKTKPAIKNSKYLIKAVTLKPFPDDILSYKKVYPIQLIPRYSPPAAKDYNEKNAVKETTSAKESAKPEFFLSDTAAVAEPVKRKFSAEPMKATMMAVAFPGLGQIYNRKFWKIPVVYAGFGGLIYSAGINSSKYQMFMQAYRDFKDLIPETDSYVDIITADPATYDPVKHPSTYSRSTASTYEERMLRFVDYHKRYRDLSYIGIGAWYLLSILDANVDASLFNYDISDNLDITFYPIQLPMPGGYMGAGLNVSMTVNF